MQDTKQKRMGILNSLKGAKIRFNPRPWAKPQNLEIKTVRTEQPTTIQRTTINDNSVIRTEKKTFVDLHMEVASKVDALIHEMEGQEEENIEKPSKQEMNLTPENTFVNIKN